MARRAADRLQSLQQEADRLASEERTLLGDLRRLELEREIKAEGLRDLAEKTAGATRELTAVNDELQRLEQEDRQARPELASRVVDLYKLGQGRYLRLLLSISDVRQISQASRMVTALAKRDRDRVAAAETRRIELASSRERLQARERELATLRVGAERAQAEANRAVQARNELISTIDGQRDLNAQLVGELSAAQQKLQATLKDLSGAARDAGLLPLRPFRGDLDWPVAGTVRQRFGAAAEGRASNGIQIAAAEGLPVHAVHEGTVAFADPFVGFGNLVIVEHDPQTFSLYGNLSSVTVARGARIDGGQELGSVGVSPTGSAGLYFELRVDGRPVDPLQWLKKK
jgi:septal ring factor EnvC (AmiA/AmiB activator)